MPRKTLAAGRRRIHVNVYRSAKRFLERFRKLAQVLVVSFGVSNDNRAADVAKQLCGGRVCRSLALVPLALPHDQKINALCGNGPGKRIPASNMLKAFTDLWQCQGKAVQVVANKSGQAEAAKQLFRLH